MPYFNVSLYIQKDCGVSLFEACLLLFFFSCSYGRCFKLLDLYQVARGFSRGIFELKSFAEDKAESEKKPIALSALKSSENGSYISSGKLTLFPVKKWKATRKQKISCPLVARACWSSVIQASEDPLFQAHAASVQFNAVNDYLACLCYVCSNSQLRSTAFVAGKNILRIDILANSMLWPGLSSMKKRIQVRQGLADPLFDGFGRLRVLSVQWFIMENASPK